ncbi:MAG: hypothetical protein HY072_04985 [Deltaproteobacteria bacterium]|nr:hypothetical protein [Deltaproteobacteria bacterium]
MYNFLFLSLILFLSHVSQAEELREFYKGARALGMGNAFVALADDEQAIFYNPAGLAAVKKLSFHYLPVDILLSSDLLNSYSSGLGAFQNISGDTLNVIMGKNIFGEMQVAPSFVMPNIGVGVIVDSQIAIYSQNKTLPQITIGYQTTNGIQVAYGLSVMRGFRKKADLRFGVAAKMLWRRGGYHLLPPMTLVNLSTGTIQQVMGEYGRAVGLDFGSQFVYNIDSRLSIMLGTVITDAGDTTFTGGQADMIKNNVSAGAAIQYSLRVAQLTFTYDLRHILQKTDWRKRNHIGGEFSMPFLRIYLGINQIYASYGASFDAWLFKLTALSYAEELGTFVNQQPSRRWLIKASLKFDL